MVSGLGLAAYGAAQPQIQQLMEMQQKKAQQQQLINAYRQYAAQQQAGAQPTGVPGVLQQPPMPGAPMPGAPQGAPGQPPAPGGMPGGQQPSMPMGMPGGPQQGGSRLPSPEQMLDILSKSGAPDDQVFGAWQQYVAAVNPIDKMQNQFDMKMQALDAKKQQVQEQQDFLIKIKQMGNDVTTAGQDKRSDTAANAAEIASLKDEYNEAENDYRAAINDPKRTTASFQTAKDARDQAKLAYDNARMGSKTKPAAASAPAGSKAPAAAASTAAPSADDTAYLKANPDQAANFDAEFGKGAAAKILGQ